MVPIAMNFLPASAACRKSNADCMIQRGAFQSSTMKVTPSSLVMGYMRLGDGSTAAIAFALVQRNAGGESDGERGEDGGGPVRAAQPGAHLDSMALVDGEIGRAHV